MKAWNPKFDRMEVCTPLPAYHQGKDWIRFDDGGLYPKDHCKPIICEPGELAFREPTQEEIAAKQRDFYRRVDRLRLEPKHTDTWHQPQKRDDVPFVVGGNS